MRTLSTPKLFVFVLIGLGLGLFLAFVNFVATRDQLRYIGAHNLDKIPHFAGGVFLAIAYEWTARKQRMWRMLSFVVGVAALWEVYEFFFDRRVAAFAAETPDLWRSDVGGDIGAAIVGAVAWWALSRRA